VLRGALPALFAVAMGVLIGAVERGEALGPPLGLVGVVFVLLQVLTPVHQALSANLGSPHRGLALRPAHPDLRRAPGNGPPRGPRTAPRTWPWRATSTSASRPAARDLDGLHRLGADVRW
jgi:hypothetical protein